MTITSVSYQNDGSVLVNYSDGSSLITTDADVNVNVWKTSGGIISPYVPPVLPLDPNTSVSDRQFFQAAAVIGLITDSDALAMMSVGTIPSTLASAINMLPLDQQFSAKMKIIGARTFIRNDPFVGALSTAMGQTSTQVDALFSLAMSL